jgi:2-keto-3-deoxy-L-rhamnonate aldolase RhmA
MALQENNLKKKLDEGLITTGSAIFSWSPNMMEVAGYSGLDFIRIDTEHSWRRDAEIENLIRAAYLTGVVPIIRIDGNDEYLPRKAYEIGAGGIIATDIDTVEAAKSLVSSAKFPPKGTRGYSGNCWSGGWGNKAGAEWIAWSNRELLVGIMVESLEAIDQIDDIMAVEGVDFALFGPADYSMALGIGKPSKNDKRVQDALRRTISAAKSAGKHVMYNPGTNEDEIRKAAKMGITMIEIGNDLGIARSVWANAVKVLSPKKAK